MVMALFSFANGLIHSSANSFLLRRFAEILIGMASFLSPLTPCVRKPNLVWVTPCRSWPAGSAPGWPVLFYVLPQDITVGILDRLARFDYPGGEGALRFIEDDPSGTMRAIGTAVDPNVLGGMMILVGGLLVPQLFTRETIFPRWFMWI